MKMIKEELLTLSKIMVLTIRREVKENYQMMKTIKTMMILRKYKIKAPKRRSSLMM